MENYADRCRQGREEAVALLHRINGDQEKVQNVVRLLREAAADETGRGVGVMTVIAAAAINQF